MRDFRLTRYELELLDVLWTIGSGTVQDVVDGLNRELAYTTVMTTLNLLVTKKAVLERVKNGRAFTYRPVVSRDEVSRSVLTDLKEVLFQNHLPSLVLNLMVEADITDANAAILREAIQKLEQQQ